MHMGRGSLGLTGRRLTRGGTAWQRVAALQQTNNSLPFHRGSGSLGLLVVMKKKGYMGYKEAESNSFMVYNL